MVHEYVLPGLGIREDTLAAWSVDVAMRGEDERAARLAEVPTGLVEEWAMSRTGSANENLQGVCLSLLSSVEALCML